MRRLLSCLTVILILAGCSSQRAEQRAAAADAGGGCKIDANLVCENVRNGPSTMGGYRTDNAMVEQNQAATGNLSVPITMQNGDVAVEVVCEIKPATRSVVYAHVSKPPTNQAEWDFVRSSGLCAE